MRFTLLFVVILLVSGCEKSKFSSEKNSALKTDESVQRVEEKNSSVKINQNKNTVRERFSAPENYVWVEEKPNSFGYFIENFKLKPYGTKILKYDGTPIVTQNLHEAVFDRGGGGGGLQQCADAIIRLRAEYLKSAGKEDEIGFHYTSGHLLKWSDYKNGHRLLVEGNRVTPAIISAVDPSVNSFQNYLDNIYNYAGTISQNRETIPVTKNEDLQTGDILITAGSPGHVVFIAGVSKNKEGKKLYLLGEGFTPAQSISIMKNPHNPAISPWYELDVNADEITTSRYVFKPVNFRRYP